MSRWVILAVAFVLLCPGPAVAAPFLVSDPYAAPAVVPDYFKVTMDAAAPVNSPAFQVPTTSGYILHHDLAGVTVAQHSVKVSACKAATIWGPEVCSVEVPFTFTRPGAPVAPPVPSGIGLASQ